MCKFGQLYRLVFHSSNMSLSVSESKEKEKPFLGSEWTDENHIDVDRVLTSFGSWPRYNISILFLTKMSWYVFCTQIIVMAFIGITPPFYCAQADDDTEFSNTSFYDKQCTIKDQIRNSSIECGTNGSHIVFDQTEPETIATEWNLVCDKSALVQLGTTSLMIGQLVGSLIVSQISDRFGRRWPLMICNWSCGILGILSALSPSFIIFIILRFLVGFFAVGAINIGYIACCEFVSPQLRPLMRLISNVIWTLSYCLTGVLAMYIRNWRHLCLALYIPVAITAIMYWLLPETLHWLVAHNRIKAANKWIHRAEKYNKITINMEKCLIVKKADKRVTKRHLGDVFKSPIVLFYTLLSSYFFFVGTLVYWGLSLFSTNFSEDHYTGFILSGLIELPAGFLSPLLLLIFGRKTIGIVSCLISAVSLIVLAALPFTAPSELRIFLFLMGKFGNIMTWSSTAVLIPEVLPTTVRNVAYGVVILIGNVGSTISPYVGQLGESNPSLPPAIFGIMSLVAAFLHLFFPETKGQEMPEDINDINPGPFLKLFMKKK